MWLLSARAVREKSPTTAQPNDAQATKKEEGDVVLIVPLDAAETETGERGRKGIDLSFRFSDIQWS